MLRAHHAAYGTAPDGRLFRGTRGGPLSESLYGRAWHGARIRALGAELAASRLARRPYDLRHAAMSSWLNAAGDPAQIAARAGNSVAVLLSVYTHCVHGHDDLLNQQISRVLGPPARPSVPVRGKPAVHRPRDPAEVSGYTDRAMDTDAGRHTLPGPPTAHKPCRRQTGTVTSATAISAGQSYIRATSEQQRSVGSGPQLAQKPSPTVDGPHAKADATIR
jgi:hypothetical protein